MEKKNNKLVIILMGVIIVVLGVLCYLFATGKIELSTKTENTVKEENNNKEEKEQDEINIDDFINNYSSVLGWNYIISKRMEKNGQIDSKGDILASSGNRQLLVGEYIASNPENESKFIVFSAVDGSKIESNNLHDEITIAFYPYEDFNIEYKKIFGKDFDISMQERAKMDEELVDYNKYVYYLNYRSGSNGINLKEMNTYENNCSDNTCSVKVKMKFSDRFIEEFGFETSDALITYHIQNGSIALDSFKEL